MPKQPLSDFGVSQRKTGTGINVGASSQTQQVYGKKTENLAKTLNSLMMQTGQVVQAQQQLSGDAATRIAEADAISIYDEFERLDGTKTDTSNRDDLVQAGSAFVTQTRKTFDDPNVQAVYDDALRKQTHRIIASKLSQWNGEQTKIDMTKRKDDFFINANKLGHTMSREALALNRQRMSDIMTPDEVDKTVAISTVSDFRSKWEGQFDSFAFPRGIFDNTGKVQYDKAKDTFNEFFGTFATMQDSGEIKFDESIGSETKQMIADGWKMFLGSVPKRQGSLFNARYEDFKRNSQKDMNSIDTGIATSQDIKYYEERINMEIAAIRTADIPLTDKQSYELDYIQVQTHNMLKKRKEVEDLFATNPDAAVAIANGGVVNPENTGFTFDVSQAYVSNVAKSQIREQEQVVLSTDVNSPEFSANVVKLIQTADDRRMNSPLLDKFADKMSGIAGFSSIDEVKRTLAIMGQIKQYGGYSSRETLSNSTFKNVAERILYDDTMTDDKKVAQINIQMQSARTAVFSRINDGELRRTYQHGMELASKNWTNTHISSDTLDAILFMNAANGYFAQDAEEAKNIIEDSTVRLGGFFQSQYASWFGDKEASLAIKLKDRDGTYLPDSTYETALEVLVDNYNEKYPENTISVTDLFVDSKFVGGRGKDQASWILYAPDPMNERAKGVRIGEFNGDNFTVLASTKNFSQGGGVAALTVEGDVERGKVSNSITFANKGQGQFVEGVDNRVINRIVMLESGKKGYRAENPSGAYGRYQIMPEVAKQYSAKLGINYDEWKKPSNQDAIFKALTNDNISGLKKANLEVNAFSIYGVHQQGLAGFKRIMSGSVGKATIRNMRANLPSDIRNVRDEDVRDTWIKYWKERTGV